MGDLPKVVERRVEEVIDWMVASDLRQWQGVTEHLERRRREHADRIVGSVSGGFEHDRARLLEDARREAQRAVESYDRDAESEPAGRLGAGGRGRAPPRCRWARWAWAPS